MKVATVLVLYILYVHTVVAQPPANKPNTVLWAIVNAKNDTSYLLGTFHEFGASYYKRYPVIEGKMTNAKAFYLERVDQSTYFPTLGLMGGIRTTWVDTLSKKDHKAVDRYLKRLGFKEALKLMRGLDAIELKYSMLLHLYEITCGVRQNRDELSMEDHIYYNYRHRGRGIQGLEKDSDTLVSKTLRFVSGEDSEKEAVASIIDIAKNESRYMDSIRIWGQCKSAEEYMNADIDYHFDELSVSADSNYVYALDQRNANWIPVIKQAVDKEQTFIAVGMGHLYYKNGLINLLMNEGYRVLPVAIKP